MVVDHPARLHKRIYRYRPDELKTKALHLFGNGVGNIRPGGDFPIIGYIVYYRPPSYFVSEISGKGTVIFFNINEYLGIVYDSL